MTSPSCQDGGPLREWAPLTTLLQKLPAKFQMGLFAQDINFTCIDAVTEFIAIGTNHGLVYWFNRKTGKLETLDCENANSNITCVKVVSTVDYMVAAGNDQGAVTIFQIPKQIPDSLPESLKPKKKKQVEIFNIRDLHKVPVTALEWSKNGMKLFSGDQNGFVVLTEMDFYMHLSKSTRLLNEKYPVVQLSYQNGLLLISTLFRTIIVDRNQNDQVKQVGQKERKMLGKFGAVFSKNRSHFNEPVIYAIRPGLRIWQADKSGTVLKTLIFKDAVKMEQAQVELLNPVSNTFRKKKHADPMFGIIRPFSDNLLVTHNEDVIYILNPNEITITSVVTDLRKVTDVACSEDEIFVLEGERNILRISCYPEIDTLDTDQNESLDQTTPVAESSKPISWGFSELTSKLKSSPIVPAIPFDKIKPTNLIQSTSILPPIVIGIDTTSVVDAEEAIEVPPVVPLNLDTPLVTEIETLRKQTKVSTENKNKSIDRKEIFEKIGKQDFEEVVFTPKRKDKKFSNKGTSSQSLQLTKPLMNDSNIPTNSQQINVDSVSSSSNNSLQTLQSKENNFILEPEKNLEIIQKAVQDKEKLLSTYLELDLSKYMDKIKISNTNLNSCASIESHSTNLISNDLMQSCIASKNKKAQFLKNEESDETRLFKSQDLVECNENGFAKSKTIDQQTSTNESQVKDTTIAESHFNELSKEFVKSAIHQEKEDWILLG